MNGLTFLLGFAGFLVGSSIGSFLGCAIYRVPRRISLVEGRSACPSCGHQLTPRELVPVFSYLFQRGRSRCCGQPLSPAYLWAELACGVMGAGLSIFFGNNLQL